MIRNVWSNAVIFCGHFPDGAEKFTKTDMIGEPKGQWYLRQMLGSANFNAGPALRFTVRSQRSADRCRGTGDAMAVAVSSGAPDSESCGPTSTWQG
ncbi:linoleoyl-CoA desaturase [Mycobacterium tuberculosis]|nr:linoleoyl-CoA desaturase [Mycobacterium tuberculosis]